MPPTRPSCPVTLTLTLTLTLTIQARTIKAFTTSLPTIAVDLELEAKSTLGLALNLLTPSNNFLRKSFMQKFDGYPRKFKASVQRFLPSPDGVSASDRFTLLYADRTELSLSKAELIDKLTTDADNERLMGDSRWQLRCKIVSWRFAAFSYFMLDVHDLLAILSKSFQSNSLVVNGISRNVNKALKGLKKLTETPGSMEAAFWKEVKADEGADMLHGKCQLEDGVEGRSAFKEDRKQVLAALNDHLIQRYRAVLDDPVLHALHTFDHTSWPSKESLLDGIYDENIKTLYHAFKRFYEPDETLELVTEQWNEMAVEINNSLGLASLKHHELWARMLVHRHSEYPLALRLVAISLLLPVDSSESERIFSLMNDIKTALRSCMGTENLKNLMLWHRMARKLEEDGSLSAQHMACYDVPVMEIVEEYRAMGTAGVRGRNAHRPFPIPTYTYQAGLTKEAKGAMEQAKGHTVQKGQTATGSPKPATRPTAADEVPTPAAAAEMPTPAAAAEVPTADVDNMTANGHFARMGEAATPPLGEHAGTHLPPRRMEPNDA